MHNTINLAGLPHHSMMMLQTTIEATTSIMGAALTAIIAQVLEVQEPAPPQEVQWQPWGQHQNQWMLQPLNVQHYVDGIEEHADEDDNISLASTEIVDFGDNLVVHIPEDDAMPPPPPAQGVQWPFQPLLQHDDAMPPPPPQVDEWVEPPVEQIDVSRFAGPARLRGWMRPSPYLTRTASQRRLLAICPICLDLSDEDEHGVYRPDLCRTLECGHQMHRDCMLERIARRQFDCPYCRNEHSFEHIIECARPF